MNRAAAPWTVSTLTAITLALLPACAPPPDPGPREVVDLTHPFNAETIYWPTETGFELNTRTAGVTERGFYYEAHTFAAPEHGGTHLDAPVHFWQGGAAVDAIPARRLIGPGVRVDVSGLCARDADYRVTVEDLEAWEYSYGRIPEGAIVLLHTGFSARWPDRESYMGTAERGEQAVSGLHFPGLHEDAAAWLAAERSIGAVGIDTPSIDHGPSRGFASHVELFRNGIPALENVAHLDRLPSGGFTVVALPMLIEGGSGAPTRIVALLD